MRFGVPCFAAAAAGVLLSLGGIARADSEVCLKAYEAAQVARADSKLIDARRELVVCAQSTCPSALRRDCATWLDEVANETPSLGFRIIGKDGCDRPDASIAIDKTPIPNGAQGRAIEVDPGAHSIQVTVDKQQTVQDIVVSQAERRRLVTITFPGGALATCGSPDPSKQDSLPPQPPETKTISPLVYVLGGFGLLSAGVATSFGISGFDQKSTLDDCKGHCGQHDVDTMQRTFLVSDIATALAVVSFGVAAYLYLKPHR